MTTKQRTLIVTGYPQIASTLFEAIRDADNLAVGCITRAGATAVSDVCERYGVPSYVFPTLKEYMSIPVAMKHSDDYRQEVAKAIREIRSMFSEVDVIVVWGMHVLPDELLAIARMGIFNVHPSDLPDYRGGFPLQAQILDGCESTRVTLHTTTSKIDHGSVLGRSAPIAIDSMETMTSLVNKCLVAAQPLVASALRGRVEAEPLRLAGCARSAWGIRTEIVTDAAGQARAAINHGILAKLRIDWERDEPGMIERAVRAFDMMGGPYSDYAMKPVRFTSARVVDDEQPVAPPGTILHVEDSTRLIVASRRGLLELGTDVAPGVPFFESKTAFKNSTPIATYTGLPLADQLTIIS